MSSIKAKKSELISQTTLAKLIPFLKAQLSAFLGGIVDYGVMILLTELVHIHYTLGIVIGGMIGAYVNFKLNNKWTFYSKENPYSNRLSNQLLRFIVVVINSIFLKSTGTFAITNILKLDYKISRIITDLIVSIGFNYTLQRYWVFKKS